MNDNEKGTEAVVEEIKQKAEDLHQKDLTTGERLDKFFSQPGAHYSEPAQVSPPAAEEKQPEPTPSSKQNETPSQASPESSVSEEEALANSKNPERTREYIEKLKAENERLKKEERKYGGSVFDEFRQSAVAPQQQSAPQVPQYPVQQPQQVPLPPIVLPYQGAVQPQQVSALSQPQVDNITQQFVDKDGNVDINGLNSALVTAQRRALAAEQQAQQASIAARQSQQSIERFEEDSQVREAHAAVPEIDPLSKKFDPELFKLVRDRVLNNMWQGKKEKLIDVAQSLQKFRGTRQEEATVNIAKAKDEAVTQYKEAQKARDQMPMESGVGQSRTVSFEEARKVTRRGGIDNPALDERMRRAGIIS